MKILTRLREQFAPRRHEAKPARQPRQYGNANTRRLPPGARRIDPAQPVFAQVSK